MTPRFLINDDGALFDASELQDLSQILDGLGNAGRKEYRNNNACKISRHHATKFLIVSGPGTGKSHLFLEKINHWHQKKLNAKVAVMSFVRKLVADLHSDISEDKNLTKEQKGHINVSTLHTCARSIVEKNHGTKEWPFNSYFRMIGPSWKKVVWDDVLNFIRDAGIAHDDYEREAFEEQLHKHTFGESDGWRNIKEMYFKLCKFYNAAGFPDLILRAIKALEENPDLNEKDYFIIDEYQDFNLSEKIFIDKLVNDSKGVLIVGDDEQVLYENLKSGTPTFIRELYKDKEYANGMLPFCGRSSYHITMSASYFIKKHRGVDCIYKIYLPLTKDSNEQKVHVFACAQPSTAVDYIKKFVDDHKSEINERKERLISGDEKDAFLLILSPSNAVQFYVNTKYNGKQEIDKIVAEYKPETNTLSEDYYKLLSYRSLAEYPYNNFTFRKILHHEGISSERVHKLLKSAMRNKQDLHELEEQEVKDIMRKVNEIKNIINAAYPIAEKLDKIVSIISIGDRAKLENDMERKPINIDNEEEVANQECEIEEEKIQVKQMGAIELMTIVGSKGLSADHVIIIGFDNVNMKYVTKNAFYVAITRARKSVHLLTALQSKGAKQSHEFLEQLPDDHIEFYKYTKGNRSKEWLQDRKKFKNYINNLSRNRRGK